MRIPFNRPCIMSERPGVWLKLMLGSVPRDGTRRWLGNMVLILPPKFWMRSVRSPKKLADTPSPSCAVACWRGRSPVNLIGFPLSKFVVFATNPKFLAFFTCSGNVRPLRPWELLVRRSVRWCSDLVGVTQLDLSPWFTRWRRFVLLSVTKEKKTATGLRGRGGGAPYDGQFEAIWQLATASKCLH